MKPFKTIAMLLLMTSCLKEFPMNKEVLKAQQPAEIAEEVEVTEVEEAPIAAEVAALEDAELIEDTPEENTEEKMAEEEVVVVAEEAAEVVEEALDPTVVTAEQEQAFKNNIIEASKDKLNHLVGKVLYSGFLARKQGFASAGRVQLETVNLGAFKCKRHDPSGVKVEAAEQDVWCHFYSNYHFKNARGEKRVYKDLMKMRMTESGQPDLAPEQAFQAPLNKAFVTQDPLANTAAYKRHLPNLKEGRLAIGMPEKFLRVVWGNPENIVDFELNASGRRETFVYRDYFVILKNRVVSSVHRFNDVKPADSTAGL